MAQLIKGIAEVSRKQADQATTISNGTKAIRDITVRTTAGTRETALSIGELAKLATTLRKSVAGFKLPEEGAAAVPMGAGVDERAQDAVQTADTDGAESPAGSAGTGTR
jgi:twitching motility protein PilJ